MRAVQPFGTAPGTPYHNGDPMGGSAVDAAFFNVVNAEMLGILTAAGMSPSLDDSDLTQLAKAIVKMIAAATGAGLTAAQYQRTSPATPTAQGGTADAITATYSPAITEVYHGLTLWVRATAANTTATPTFTPAPGVIPPIAIVKGGGDPLAVGDIAGARRWLTLRYDADLAKWVLLNPAAPTLGVATSAMVQAGTDDETAITPAALRGAMPATLAATGGAAWPNGLTFKWGFGQTTSSGSNISFDLAFKQECYSVYVNDGSYSTMDSFSTEGIYPSYFQVKSSSPSVVGFRWFAIGK